jgi:hypothetical protein
LWNNLIRREEKMKKLFLLIVIGLFLAGCGASARESGFWEHDTLYKNWDHARYSWSGYKNPTAQTGKNSSAQGWWGKEIPYVPAE